MIERKIIKDRLNEYLIDRHIAELLDRVGYSHSELHKTPLGEKIVVHAARPGLVVGAKGGNIKKITKILKHKFQLENPQIEINEIKVPGISAALIAENIVTSLERFGAGGFKGVGYRVMDEAIKQGALGIEVLMTGKIPSSRSKRWRFYMGYLKKCGDIAVNGVDVAYSVAKLKSGVVGIQVRVMPGDLVLPDKVQLKSTLTVEQEEQTVASETSKEHAEQKTASKEDKKEKTEKKPAKKTTKKTVKKTVRKKVVNKKGKDEQ
ncbi:MAG: 30S ribosomal protein S3 [Candidatus Woesearchaeota archaeon]